MSWHTYRAAGRLLVDGPSFEALLMAAMLRADSENLLALQRAFPDVWDELAARYHAPGGVLEDDPDRVRAYAMPRDLDGTASVDPIAAVPLAAVAHLEDARRRRTSCTPPGGAA